MLGVPVVETALAKAIGCKGEATAIIDEEFGKTDSLKTFGSCLVPWKDGMTMVVLLLKTLDGVVVSASTWVVDVVVYGVKLSACTAVYVIYL